MTERGWRGAIFMAATNALGGDESMVDLLAKLLTEQDRAKEDLRRLGFGVTGTPWPDVVDEIATVLEDTLR